MDNLFGRKYVIQGLFIAIGLILLGTLFYIQIASDKYFLSAEFNVLRKIYTFPARGVIFDRNEKPLAQNEAVYDLMVIPNQVKEMDTLALCNIIGIDTVAFRKNLKKVSNQSRYQPGIFERQLSVETYATLSEQLSRFPGFFVQSRTIRHYPDSVAAHFLGYIKEVSSTDIQNSEGYYRSGDYIGKSGVEKSYETLLRGERGVVNMLYDARNVPKGSYAEGRFDTAAVSGDRLISSLDLKLQKLGEELMHNKVGSIVAIEPASGEILAFVSSPSYDPNLMVGRQSGNNYMKILVAPNRPFTIRPIQGYYSPGSSFKPLDALIGLQEGVIDPNTTFNCPGYFRVGNHTVKCEHVDGNIALRRGLARSCNTYACYVFQKLITQRKYANQKLAYDDWQKKVRKFGLGEKSGIDLPSERAGRLYDAAYYSKKYSKYWNFGTVISLAIGQGEMDATPLQMANIMAIIANRGYYIKPHLVKAIGKDKVIKKEYVKKNYVDVDAVHFDPVIDGMQDAVNAPWGTAIQSRIEGILMCGKTGTVQNPRGKNHSVFIGFAPRDNPKIAIAVIVENAGYGSTYAAPIASYIAEQYLKGSLPKNKLAQVEWMKKQVILPVPPKPKVKPKVDTTDSTLKIIPQVIKPDNKSTEKTVNKPTTK
ncbi:penicillin-binding protein 2 [Pedobacter heparinus]|uniref:Penicillin-binding protein 2 n=1 Tax=Pedobacter heparinus (strain ATCC 13125 / DSM 2366 / CIP 104194 / JCM 7457 / NBRC 12017 / NCIMB 9290 / NRRL B-14731 / HIM 762-3) TaxID=485917 RepID=C6Y234_PEDHD|nr:penicillin-binding protein 2 [Pedobacter heparinus]ACU03027.1 penicillin-binding protein 2 [Pedobacter heparinus DSM 2366]